jgi:ketosteroid isomerase-like protein
MVHAMSQQNVAAAKRIYDSRNRGDVDAVLAECDSEVEWRPHLASLSGQPIRGIDGVREYLESLREEWESFRHEPERFMDAGDKVVVLLHTYARGRASGVNVDVPVAHVLTFERGRCSKFVSYYDRAQALRSAGLAE